MAASRADLLGEDDASMEQKKEIFALLVTLQALESAYMKDFVRADDYRRSCESLLSQYRFVRDTMSGVQLQQFAADYRLDCRHALGRINAGVPATVEHGVARNAAETDGEHIFEAVQNFITVMDGLKLGSKACDEVLPYLNAVIEALNKIVDLPPDHPSKAGVLTWIKTMSGMRAADELSPDQIRQLQHDLETAYTALHKHVKSRRR